MKAKLIKVIERRNALKLESVVIRSLELGFCAFYAGCILKKIFLKSPHFDWRLKLTFGFVGCIFVTNSDGN